MWPGAALPAAGAGQRRRNDAYGHNPPERWLQRTGCGWMAGSARYIGRGLCWMLNGYGSAMDGRRLRGGHRIC